MINVLRVVHDTTVDGPGLRTSIYCAGCRHRCPGCHNPQSWAFGGGTDRSTGDLLREIMSDPFADVTFTGGDPLFQAEGFTELAKSIKAKTGKTIWCYTGFRYEDLLHDDAARHLLRYIDVLVDGPFVQELRDESLLFRGSGNQRLVDVPRSRQEGCVVLWERENP